MQQNKFRKAIVAILMPMILVVSFGNCFGKFAIVKKVYEVNDSFNIGSGLLAKFIKTLVMYFPFSILYFVGFFFDLILFNLIEFWSGNNPVGYNEYDENGKYVKAYEENGEKLLLSYSDFGKRLDIQFAKEGNSQNLIVFRAEPGKFFVEKDGKLEEIVVSSETVGSKTILKMAEQGKLKSTKVVDTKTLNDLEAKLVSESL
ncbi:PF11810 domain protein [Leptospira interrogans str. 2006001854]|uniref:PF11810 domain protein n=1 Tax=Leptospira interrogans str. 2006001854 TaxID=1001590 RepID=M6GA82_LEPIR|nr:PF11810 domain protein [Leptospira interrogans str. 2006001854]